MAQIKLTKDWPDYPKDTLLTLDEESGVYKTEDGKLQMHKDFIGQFDVQDATPIPDGTEYFYLSDKGEVLFGTVDKEAQFRKEFGNFFLSEEEALKARQTVSTAYAEVAQDQLAITVK